MLKLILQAALLAGGIALGMSKLDSGAIKRIEDSMSEFAGAVGWREAATVPSHQEVQNTQSGGAVIEAGSQMRQESAPSNVPRKAFFGPPPEGCHWEKVIDPSDGSVRCSIPERRTNQDR